jgi:hypothetical protein
MPFLDSAAHDAGKTAPWPRAGRVTSHGSEAAFASAVKVAETVTLHHAMTHSMGQDAPWPD